MKSASVLHEMLIWTDFLEPPQLHARITHVPCTETPCQKNKTHPTQNTTHTWWTPQGTISVHLSTKLSDPTLTGTYAGTYKPTCLSPFYWGETHPP